MKVVREKAYGRVVTFTVSEPPSEEEIKRSKSLGFEVTHDGGNTVNVTGGNPWLVKRLEAIRNGSVSL